MLKPSNPTPRGSGSTARRNRMRFRGWRKGCGFRNRFQQRPRFGPGKRQLGHHRIHTGAKRRLHVGHSERSCAEPVPDWRGRISVHACRARSHSPLQLVVTGTTGAGGGIFSSYSGTVNAIQIPEPGTWALMLAGLGALASWPAVHIAAKSRGLQTIWLVACFAKQSGFGRFVAFKIRDQAARPLIASARRRRFPEAAYSSGSGRIRPEEPRRQG